MPYKISDDNLLTQIAQMLLGYLPNLIDSSLKVCLTILMCGVIYGVLFGVRTTNTTNMYTHTRTHTHAHQLSHTYAGTIVAGPTQIDGRPDKNCDNYVNLALIFFSQRNVHTYRCVCMYC